MPLPLSAPPSSVKPPTVGLVAPMSSVPLLTVTAPLDGRAAAVVTPKTPPLTVVPPLKVFVPARICVPPPVLIRPTVPPPLVLSAMLPR